MAIVKVCATGVGSLRILVAIRANLCWWSIFDLAPLKNHVELARLLRS